MMMTAMLPWAGAAVVVFTAHPTQNETRGRKREGGGGRGGERRPTASKFEAGIYRLFPSFPYTEEESNTCPRTPPPILFLSILEGGGIVRVN